MNSKFVLRCGPTFFWIGKLSSTFFSQKQDQPINFFVNQNEVWKKPHVYGKKRKKVTPKNRFFWYHFFFNFWQSFSYCLGNLSLLIKLLHIPVVPIQKEVGVFFLKKKEEKMKIFSMQKEKKKMTLFSLFDTKENHYLSNLLFFFFKKQGEMKNKELGL